VCLVIVSSAAMNVTYKKFLTDMESEDPKQINKPIILNCLG
jgi:hypothetical protein